MSFTDWLFEAEGFVNPPISGQWKFLHIMTLVLCALTIIAFYFMVKKSNNKEKLKKIIIITLVSLILFFEVASRIVYIVRLYYYHDPYMNGTGMKWIMLPKPWCAISCWVLMISVLVRKKFFYNYASLSALLCAIIFFVYPGVGYNNKYIMFSNLYSIVTHALLLITSITLIVFKYTEFKYKNLWKVMICFALTVAYALLQIYVLKIHHDPLYFMPNGDIQAGILRMNWGIYITLYCLFILVYINTFYLIEDKQTLKTIFSKNKKQ